MNHEQTKTTQPLIAVVGKTSISITISLTNHETKQNNQQPTVPQQKAVDSIVVAKQPFVAKQPCQWLIVSADFSTRNIFFHSPDPSRYQKRHTTRPGGTRRRTSCWRR